MSIAQRRADQTGEEKRLRSFIEDARSREELRLPAEQALADAIGITRARLRGILKRLETEGLIWRHVGKGTFIGERSLSGDIEALQQLINPADAFESRLILEPHLAALAAQRATRRQLDDMEHCLEAMEALPQFSEWAVWDERLHRLIAKAADNKLLLVLYDTIRESAPTGMRHRLHAIFAQAPFAETNIEHRAYVAAIASGDAAGAEALMRQHLLSIRRALFPGF